MEVTFAFGLCLLSKTEEDRLLVLVKTPYATSETAELNNLHVCQEEIVNRLQVLSSVQGSSEHSTFTITFRIISGRS